MRKLLAMLSFAAFITSAHADTGLHVTDVWARATPSVDSTAAVYFTVTNSGAADQLTGASTPVAAHADLHQTTTDGGISRMRKVEQPVTIDAAHPFSASPNGYHLMLTGLKQQLKGNTEFPLTLTFAKAGAIQTTVKVQAAATTKPAPATDSMDGMDMSH